MKHKSRSHREAREKAVIWFNTPDTVEKISTASPGDAVIDGLFGELCGFNVQTRITDVNKFIDYGLSVTEKGTPVHVALRNLLVKVRQSKRVAEAGHREKRALALALGLKKNSKTVAELLAAAGSGRDTGVKIVWRSRSTSSSIRLRTVLGETKCRSQDDAIVNETTGFYVVGPTESVIFVSRSEETAEITTELIVIRGVAHSAEESEELYTWASNVVAQACSDRRNVRPAHDGSIVQLGWNAGPRHAIVWGLAKSWNKKIDIETMVSRDEDAIALLTVCWGLAKAHFPWDAMDHIERRFDSSGLPHIATRNVSEGDGYRIEINGKKYLFPNVTRAPPEGYFSQDYVAWAHQDKCFTDYAIAWCVDRVVDNHSDTMAYTTRNRDEDRAAWPVGGGGNFVDITLRVVVKQAKATLMLFKPEFTHGTTRLCGAHNRLCTVTFSKHIRDAYNIATQGPRVDSAAGGGEGDVD